ncbi:MAG: hypothetical protein IJR51_10800 [Clostridia bacterium]|nr:hypothetical protein [Clostridia bacterium]
MRIDCKTYLEVDEIDHLTIRVRKGEPLDRKTATGMIRFYTATNETVKAAFGGTPLTLTALAPLPDEEIYDMLIKIRTALINTVL